MEAAVPMAQMNEYLRGYRAEYLREYSNAHRHVFYSRPLRKYITVRKRGGKAMFEFTDDCPCGYDD